MRKAVWVEGLFWSFNEFELRIEGRYMKFFSRCRSAVLGAAMMGACLFITGNVSAQDYSSMGITDVVATADRLLQRGDYKGAISPLREVIRRTAPLTDPQGRDTAQTCRFQLARAYYQMGDVAAGMQVLEEYLKSEPRTKERLALRMLAQGLFDTKDWGRIEQIAKSLLSMPDLEKEDLYNANLLLGQACFQQEKWADAVAPLEFAAKAAKEERVRALCQIMVVRSLVEGEDWRSLFGKLPTIYRTDSKYDIMLNLTLMKAGKALFEQDDYLNALMLYRWVLPRQRLLAHAGDKVKKLENSLQADIKRGITDEDIENRKAQILDLKESMKTLEDLPPYEEEVSFRIGQIYYEVKRYWEAFVLFDKLYQTDRNSDIGEASMLQSVLVLYDVGDIERAEKRILLYLDEKPGGQYARTLLSMMMRDNLVKQNFERVIGLKPYLDNMVPTENQDELELQSDMHYMMAFGFFQTKDFKASEEQFAIIISDYLQSSRLSDSTYYRGMARMMQGNYETALADFVAYQERYPEGEQVAPSLFREAVCLFGLGRTPESESRFSAFIDRYSDNPLVSEAYSMRGDIEASKTATEEDPYTLDRALSDYRKGIDTAATQLQSSYAAFQAAKVYKLEFKWQEIIDLMNYYMDRWEEQADVAEAVFWIGKAQIELGQVQDALTAYLDAIERFGNDTQQQGVDKIVLELVNVASIHLTEAEQDELAIKLKLKLTNIDPRMEVLKLRLEVAQAMLEGDDVAAAMGADLLEKNIDLNLATPASLSLMCDAAVNTGNVEQMKRLHEYFMSSFEDSDLLWHAYRANANLLLAKGDLWGVLAAVDNAQAQFGAEPFMGWAQILKADTQYKMEKYSEAEQNYNMVLNVPEWRGPLFAEAMYGMGKCRLASGDPEAAHSFFQRTYLLFKSYADGDWAAKGYLAAADVLIKLGREQDAIKTLQAMLEDVYTNTNPLAEQVREQLKKYGAQP